MKINDETIRAHAIKNAISHKGKAIAEPVIAALFNEGLKKSDIKKYSKIIFPIIKEVNKLSLDQQKKEFQNFEKKISKRKIRVGLPELPNVKKSGVVMRIAPSASGPLHIGHAIIAGLNILYVKKHKGKFYVRIEDTNPENIDPKSYKIIKEDVKWLYDKSKILIQSERLDLYYKYAEKLIKKEKAYICTCDANKFREYSHKKENCPCRKLKVQENLDKWRKMLDKKTYKPGEAVLRFKSSMKSKNPAMRDFPLARINETPHPLQKKKYRVWPLMNLSVSVDDIELKMTHIIRGKDHKDNAKRQELIYSALGKKYPVSLFIGKIHFKGMSLSTREMREGINSGKYKAWDDKKLPTLISLRKQGYKAEAFLKFAEKISLGENDKIIPKKEYFTLLNSFNKKKP